MRNFPSQTTEQEVKDLFRDNVGDVTYIELYSDENGKVRQMWYLVYLVVNRGAIGAARAPKSGKAPIMAALRRGLAGLTGYGAPGIN